MLFYLFFPLALIISSSLGIFISTSWAIAPFIWVLIIVPVIDFLLPKFNKQDNKLFETKFHNLSLIIVLPGIFCLIFCGLIKIGQNDISYSEAAALGAASRWNNTFSFMFIWSF